MNSLEILPNELLILIFEYLSSEELSKTFVNLNNRLNNIIKSMINMSLTLSIKFNKLKSIFNGEQFIRLVIQDCLPKQLDLKFFSSNLRSLTIFHPTVKQMECINPIQFPYLEYLNIQGSSSIICYFIFSNSFIYLSKLNLIYIDISLQWSKSPSIRFINLFSDDPLTFLRIIQSCPNLQTFIYKGGSIPSIYSLIEPHLSLKTLSLKINYCPSFERDDCFDRLLSLFPNLTKMYLSACHLNMSIPFNFLSLSQLLDRCVPQLKSFQAKIDGCPPISGSRKHIHPLFDHVIYSGYTMTISSDQNNLKKN